MTGEIKDELSLKLHANEKVMEEINAQRFNQKLFKYGGQYYYDVDLDNMEEIKSKKRN